MLTLFLILKLRSGAVLCYRINIFYSLYLQFFCFFKLFMHMILGVMASYHFVCHRLNFMWYFEFAVYVTSSEH